jgi:uncharacterized protein YcnI
MFSYDRRLFMRIALLTSVFTVIGVASASAHVEFNPDSATANKNQILDLRVPHDCSALTKTSGIRILIPAAVNLTSFTPGAVSQHGAILKGWHEKIVKSGSRTFLDVKGPATTSGPDGGKNAIDIKFTVTPTGKAGVQLKFPAVQYCNGGISVSWIQPRPADGSDPAESATPVPVLNLK